MDQEKLKTVPFDMDLMHNSRENIVPESIL